MKNALNILLISILCAFMLVQPASAARISKKPVIYKVITNQSSAKIYWKKAKNAKKYYIYRKVRGGKYRKIAVVSKKKTSYTDKKIRHNKIYYYKIKSKTSRKIYTSAAKGAKLVKMNTPIATVDVTNYHTIVHWNRVSKADGYILYRKNGHNGSYKKIATVKGKSKTSYEDIYCHSLSRNERTSLLLNNVYADPTTNRFIYTVKAYRKMKYGTSYSDCLKTGDFHLDPPAIVNVTKQSDTYAVVEWGTIANAQRYSIFSGYIDNQGNKVWEKRMTVNASSALRQSASVTVNPNHTYFTVIAEATKSTGLVSSEFDQGYHMDKRQFGEKNVLYMGDSITIGRPYLRTSEEKEVFTFPWRVKQLTDVQYVNASAPGATYTCGNGNQCHLVTDIAEKIHNGTYAKGPETYKDYDMVVIAAGTNDYMKDVELGDLNSNNPYQFCGALNEIMEWIKAGSDKRISEGKAPIKIIFIDLFYAQRAYQGGRFSERHTQPNSRGLTLTSYQDALNQIVAKYQNDGMKVYRMPTGDIVNRQNCPYVTSDTLHMTRYTYTQIGNKLAELMIDILSEPEEQIPVKPEPEKTEPEGLKKSASDESEIGGSEEINQEESKEEDNTTID